ncbi:MAG: toxic anion resistance protein [Clostridia bacterium]|nr:toxic anion resistance protein [Clostridia bacterium]
MSEKEAEVLELKVEPKKEVEKIEKEILNGEAVTEEKVESSLNYDLLTDEEKQAIDEFCAKVDVSDTTQILQYGAAAQNKISTFSDSVLQNVKTKNTGDVGDLLSDLVVQVKDFDTDVPESLNPKGLYGLFFNAKKQIEKMITKFNKVETNVAKIEAKLESQKIRMLKDITIFDTMYEKNLEYFKELSLYIIAGEKKLEELRTVTLPELQKKAEESGEQADIQAVNDMVNMINRFEKKIYDLKTTRIISIQMAPQIRLIQNNDSELVEKIQSSLINTIPLWKNQIVISLGLANSKAALGVQKQVSDTTNEMLQRNSEMLKQGTIEIAEESEKAIVNVETLQKTNKDIIETLDKVLEIHQNGRIKRVEAEKELLTIEKELKDKLLEIKIDNQ